MAESNGAGSWIEIVKDILESVPNTITPNKIINRKGREKPNDCNKIQSRCFGYKDPYA
jgi:hypothetical protein